MFAGGRDRRTVLEVFPWDAKVSQILRRPLARLIVMTVDTEIVEHEAKEEKR